MASSKSNVAVLESEFADFYCKVIPKIYDVKSHAFMRDVRIALKDIRQLKHDIRNREEKCFFAHIQYEKPHYRYAYLYAYSLLHTALVHHHFTKYVQNNRNVMLNYLKNKEVKICCLGGGPGIEAIAISKVLNDLCLENSTLKEFSSVDIYISVIDICEKWESEVCSIIDAVNKYTAIMDSKVKMHAKFIQADLLKPFNSNVEEEIQNSNIITMIKLASAIQERTPNGMRNTLQKMMTRVADCMDKQSGLLLLDNAGGTIFLDLTKFLSKRSNSVFETMTHENYTLNIRSLQKMEKLISSEKNTRYALCIPTRITTVSSCFCIKKEDTVPKKICKNMSQSCSVTETNMTVITQSKKLSSKKNQSVSSASIQDHRKMVLSEINSSENNPSGSAATTQDQTDITQSKKKLRSKSEKGPWNLSPYQPSLPENESSDENQSNCSASIDDPFYIDSI